MFFMLFLDVRGLFIKKFDLLQFYTNLKVSQDLHCVEFESYCSFILHRLDVKFNNSLFQTSHLLPRKAFQPNVLKEVQYHLENHTVLKKSLICCQFNNHKFCIRIHQFCFLSLPDKSNCLAFQYATLNLSVSASSYRR